MNSILLTTGRSHMRRLIGNRCWSTNGYKERTNFSTNGSTKSQTTPKQPNQPTLSNSSKNIAYASIAIGGLLSSYLLINSFRGQKSATTSSTPSNNESKLPTLIDDLPEEIEYLIIGGGSAAFAALRTIRANQPLSKVIVVNAENSYPYMKPPLSKELWFAEPELKKNLKYLQWNDRERSLYYAHDEFYFDLKQLKASETGGSTVLKGHKVVKIDPYDQYVILDNGQTLKYGKCLIATGSKSIKSELEKNASAEVKKRILKFGTIEDFHKVDKLVDQNKSFVLVGSEYLASELACAFTKRLKSAEVIQVMETKGNLQKILPEYLSEWASKCLQREGVKQLTSTQIKSAELQNDQVVLTLSNGEQLKTDYLIIDSGAEPNVELAKTGGLEICPLNGGILANAELQVRTNLWVAGDVSSYYDDRLGRRREPHHDNSLVTGRLAGTNMSGGKKVFYHQPIVWSDLGPKIGFEAVGVIDSSLPTISVFTKPESEDEAIKKDTKLRDLDKEIAVRLPNKSDDYFKGVVFYIGEGGVVKGVLMWNLFDKIQLARRIINENRSYDDLSDLARLFDLHKNHFELEE